jgi:hypothetical protein
MQFEITQQKFQYLLEKLIVRDMFPNSIISIKNNVLFSIQKENDINALRFVKFKNSFFDNIEGTEESIMVDIKKIHKMIKGISATKKLTIKTSDGKLSIFGEGINFFVNYNSPNKQVMTSCPFSFVDGCPVVSSEKIMLDVCFKIKLSDFKTIADYANTLKTDSYKFSISEGNFIVRIGDLHSFSDYITLTPEVEIISGENLDVIFGCGLTALSKTFDDDITVFTKSNSAGLFYEVGNEHVLGVLISPCLNKE